MLELGIYGGTYAPVHNGHITAAEAFLAQAGLDKLLIMPTLIPPHKQLSYKDDPQELVRLTEACGVQLVNLYGHFDFDIEAYL